MALAVVQRGSNSATNTVGVTLGATPTPGNLLLAVVHSSGNTGDSISIVGGGWDVITTVAGQFGMPMTIYGRVAGGSESATVQASSGLAGSVVDLAITEISGQAGTTVAEAVAASNSNSLASGSGASATTPTLTPSVDTFLLAAAGQGNAVTSPSVAGAWTLRASLSRMQTADQLAAAGSYSATFSWTTARIWDAAIVAIKGPSTFQPQAILL